MTNRDLYLAVTAALDDHEYKRSLAEYLLALRGALLRHREARVITPEEFVAALTAARTVQPEPVDTEAWRAEDPRIDEEAPLTVEDVDRVLRSQILDLEDAHATGLDRHDERYLGLDVARRAAGERALGPRWFNWDAAGYVKCGLAGTFGGWDPIEPGEQLGELAWSDIGGFLWAGQHYE